MYNATVIILKLISYGCYIAALMTFLAEIVFNTPDETDVISGAYDSYLTFEYLKLFLIIAVGIFIEIFDDIAAKAKKRHRFRDARKIIKKA